VTWSKLIGLVSMSEIEFCSTHFMLGIFAVDFLSMLKVNGLESKKIIFVYHPFDGITLSVGKPMHMKKSVLEL